MNRPVAALAGAATLVAAVGLAWYALDRPTELPEPHSPVQKDVFPELDFAAATPGSPVNRIYAGFGKEPPGQISPETPGRCIAFRYDPDLFSGALVVLTKGALVEKRWIAKGTTLPSDCTGVPLETVDLTGWYAAAVR